MTLTVIVLFVTRARLAAVRGRTRRTLRRLRDARFGRVQSVDGYTGWHDPTCVTWGRHSYGRPEIITYDAGSEARVEIGSFCSVASGVRFLVNGNHRVDLVTTSPLLGLVDAMPPGHNYSRGNIVVGNDVWIGRDATLLSGVTVGTGAVIGACAVVASDVRPYAVVVGNPAREVGRRFSDEHVASLLSSRWWEYADDELRRLLPYLWNNDPEALIKHLPPAH